jgi:hypothetical protein
VVGSGGRAVGSDGHPAGIGRMAAVRRSPVERQPVSSAWILVRPLRAMRVTGCRGPASPRPGAGPDRPGKRPACLPAAGTLCPTGSPKSPHYVRSRSGPPNRRSHTMLVGRIEGRGQTRALVPNGQRIRSDLQRLAFSVRVPEAPAVSTTDADRPSREPRCPGLCVVRR